MILFEHVNSEVFHRTNDTILEEGVCLVETHVLSIGSMMIPVHVALDRTNDIFSQRTYATLISSPGF